MSGLTQYLFAYLLESQQPGTTFTAWPLHITLLPWFKLDVPEAEFADVGQKLLKKTKSFSLKVGPERLFNRRSVNLIESSAQLIALHNLLLDYVRNNGELINQRYIGPKFRAHITQKSGRSVKTGRLLKINHVYLISAPEGNPHTRLKTIVSQFDLS